MLNFELSTYVNDIERVITKSLAQNQKTSSDFRWYLSLNIDNAIAYNAQHETLADNKSSYLSIKPILYQRSELYASNSHFAQFSRQHQNIHNVAKPSIYLAWVNAVQPHSLSGQKAEQLLSDELMDNTAYATQALHKEKVYERDEISSLGPEESSVTSMFSPYSSSLRDNLPTNEHVEFLFQSATQALRL